MKCVLTCLTRCRDVLVRITESRYALSEVDSRLYVIIRECPNANTGLSPLAAPLDCTMFGLDSGVRFPVGRLGGNEAGGAEGRGESREAKSIK